MAIERILISVSPGETRIAELEGGRLAGLSVHRVGGESRVGDIFLGRVEAVISGLQAAFVEIGEPRSGFLALPEARHRRDGDQEDDIGDYLAEGDAVLVQVLRDAEEDKGAKLTTRIGLSGRDLVYTPGGSGVSISRRLNGEDERRRLQAVMARVGAETAGGFIVRTNAAEAEDEDLAAEAARLSRRWAEVEAARVPAKAPACLYREVEPACRVLREHGGADLESVVVDDAALFSRLRRFAEEETPDLLEIVRYHDGPGALFSVEGVDEMIDAALDSMVPLPSGANLLITETPALTAIDVNTGSADFGGRERTHLEVNKEAARELARQVRLRNLSGLLLVDFVSMRRRDSQEAVHGVLEAALGDDPRHPHLVGFTRLGLAEMTRRRQGASLHEVFCGAPSAPPRSAETTALAALRGVLAEARADRAPAYRIEVHPDVEEVMHDRFGVAVSETEERLGGDLRIIAGDTLARDDFRVYPVRDEAAP